MIKIKSEKELINISSAFYFYPLQISFDLTLSFSILFFNRIRITSGVERSTLN